MWNAGYCRKLHRDVPELNARGVSVRYLAFPRNGVDSAVGREMRQVWCAEDRQAAITAAKNRESVAAASCNDPVARHYALGRQLGIRGTPAIYLENGRMLPGYLTPMNWSISYNCNSSDQFLSKPGPFNDLMITVVRRPPFPQGHLI